MNLKNFKIDLLEKELSDYDIGIKWANVNFELEKYLLEEGYHSINEVPNGVPSEPLDDPALDEMFVWMPFNAANARILVQLPAPKKKSRIIPKIKSRLALINKKTIIGIGQFLGADERQEFYQFNFGPDLIPKDSYVVYDDEKILLEEPDKRLGNGIKERFFAEGGAGLQLAGAGGGFGGSKGGIPLPGAPVGFLWKPISESNGKLVVLVPEGGKNGGCSVNGEGGAYSGTANGGREHYRYSKPGGAYPPGVACVTVMGTFIIPDPALRYEGAG